MTKRKDPEPLDEAQNTPSKKQRTQDLGPTGSSKRQRSVVKAKLNNKDEAPSVNDVSTPQKSRKRVPQTDDGHETVQSEDELTPRPNGQNFLANPLSQSKAAKATLPHSSRTDRSAKRKSAQTLNDAEEQSDWDHSVSLARQILEEDEDFPVQTTEQELSYEGQDAQVTTPSKQGRGRPKGAKNKRSPTPEGDLPPEERFFFQNRMGPPRVSSNIFQTLGLLSHDEYFDVMRTGLDQHASEKEYLARLHRRSFLQWKFELEEGLGVCLYGYGSKRKIVNSFAEWIYPQLGQEPRVVMLNGYVARVNVRSILNIIGSASVEEDEVMKLTGQPHDMVDTILSHLSHHVKGKLLILINSIDAQALRKTSTQSVLARLATHPKVSLLATADTPTFPILWNSALKDHYKFIYHDCTTFAPYEVETNPVDDVNELLGRKSRRAGGKDGIGFVLKSLPENARNLYRVLLTEILTVVNDGADDNGNGEEDEERYRRRKAGDAAEDIGIEYKMLYQKASEEFICSSDMNFRFLLKEFHDHQMLVSKRDASGAELLGVPLSREEVEAVLEDLVLG